MNNFIAIDVETANSNMSSICQIGIAQFSGGHLVNEWVTLINPETYFDSINIRIHGIEPSMVIGQPTFPEVADKIRKLLSNTISVCHMHFDRTAINQVYARYGMEPLNTTWLDSAQVARRTWIEFASRGYGLKNICDKIGYQFKHHDALEDAKAAGFIILAAMQQSGHDLQEWLSYVNNPISGLQSKSKSLQISRDGNHDGILYGEIIVFTGELQISRDSAAAMAAQIGCRVAANVTKKTTILVVGSQDMSKLAGHEKSSKQRKAEELLKAGLPIRIIYENDFKELVKHSY
jgi:DNA polymerase-3 subunit epsilon